MSDMNRISLNDFIGNTGITAKVKRIEDNKNFDSDVLARHLMRHFLVTLKAGRFSMRVPFSQGPAHTKEPSAADVLDCLAMDACGFENARSFDDWCAEYGYDTDSRKAERIYNIIARQAAKLRAMLGQDNYETLLWNTERQ